MADRIFGYIRKGEIFVSGVVFMSALVVLTINIILRFCFKSAISWAEEFMRYTIIWVTFIGSALCAESNMHVGIDVFVQMTPPLVKKILICFAMACATFFCGYMVEFSFRNTIMLFQTMQRSPIMQVPMGVVYICMPVGSFFTALRFGRMFVQGLRKPVAEYGNKPEEIEADDINILELD